MSAIVGGRSPSKYNEQFEPKPLVFAGLRDQSIIAATRSGLLTGREVRAVFVKQQG